jgi:SAM-dependent methyltransferase
MHVSEWSRAVKTEDFILGDEYLAEIYKYLYERLRDMVDGMHDHGPIIEIGSGPGLVKYFIEGVITVDIDRAVRPDLCADAKYLPFPDGSVAGILMKDSLHHLPDVEKFLDEAQRILIDDGVIAIIDPYWGLLARFVYKYIHQEKFDSSCPTWSFESSSPWDSNQALSFLILRRDRDKLEQQWQNFEIEEHCPLVGLSFLLSGGVSRRTSIPGNWLKKLFEWENRRGRWFDPFRFEYLYCLRKRSALQR